MLGNTFSAIAQKNNTLIEFGWDYPDVTQLSVGLPLMQNTPFDGICFSLQRNIMEAFDTAAKPSNYFEYTRLTNLQWGKYHNNFIILRGFGKQGGQWFDNSAWKIICDNMLALSKSMNTPNVKGILFDPEYYYEDPLNNPWTYSKKQYPGKSLLQVQAQVKKRGTIFINSLQKFKPDLSFISIWIASLISEERKYTPIQDTRHILLISFVEGILAGKNKSVSVIDGNEYAYWNYKPSQFFEATSFLKKNLHELIKTKSLQDEIDKIQVAQPIFYDGLLATAPFFEKGFSTTTKWSWLSENIKYAMTSTDNITWFYSERLNWWTGNVNDTLSAILENAKNQLNDSRSNKQNKTNLPGFLQKGKQNINNGQGHFYSADEKTPMNVGKLAFNFNYDTTKGDLSIRFLDSIPQSLTVYVDGKLKYVYKPNSIRTIINIGLHKKGAVMILAKYNEKLEASALYIL